MQSASEIFARHEASGKKRREKVNHGSYKNLRFTNDFMFCKILSNNPGLCKELIEMILEMKIERILGIAPQEPIEITPMNRGIRLDVRVEDENHSTYCIEMQTTIDGNIPKRTRYYQALTDLNELRRGDDYGVLNKSGFGGENMPSQPERA